MTNPFRRLFSPPPPAEDEVDQPYDPEPSLEDVEPDTYDQPDVGDDAPDGPAE